MKPTTRQKWRSKLRNLRSNSMTFTICLTSNKLNWRTLRKTLIIWKGTKVKLKLVGISKLANWVRHFWIRCNCNILIEFTRFNCKFVNFYFAGSTRQELETLSRQPDSAFSIYGHRVPTLMRKIDEEFQRGRFTKKPLGPIGETCFVKLFQ